MDMQTELPIESQEDTEKALVEKLRRVYGRYGALSAFFQALREKEDSSDLDDQPQRQTPSRLAVAQCGKA
jgi:hypothetical protein